VDDVKPATSNTNYKARLKNPNGTIPGGILWGDISPLFFCFSS
jgi:hypothetical protein